MLRRFRPACGRDVPGTDRASSRSVGVRRYDELIAWQLAEAFKTEVFNLVRQSRSAGADYRYRAQLIESSSAVSKDIAEGFLRYSAGDFARFLAFALGSLGEADRRLADGIELGHFTSERCTEAFRFARRASVAITRLRLSQLRYRTQQDVAKSQRARPRATSRTRRTRRT
jgi:four helix bundle protein